jgi:Ohr subfamily peroxiredoxin
MSVAYVARATSTGIGREGHVETDDGKISLDLALPMALGGNGAGTNPEQLVAMGYAACFSSALHLTARRLQLAVETMEVTCAVSLLHAEGGYSLAFEIKASLAGLAPEAADQLIAEAHTVCPYSKAFANGAPAQAHRA